MNHFQKQLKQLRITHGMQAIASEAGQFMNHSVPIAKVKFKAPGILGKLGKTTAEVKLPVSTIAASLAVIGAGLYGQRHQ